VKTHPHQPPSSKALFIPPERELKQNGTKLHEAIAEFSERGLGYSFIPREVPVSGV